jgi:hypothetical protein
MSQTPGGKEPTDTLLLSGIHFMAAAELVPDAVPLGLAFQPVQESLSAASELVRTRTREMERPRVMVTFADIRADDATRVIGNSAKNADGGKPGKTYYQLLPGGLGDVVPLVGQSQVNVMNGVLARWEEIKGQFADDHSLVRDMAGFATCRNSYVAALAARMAAAEALSTARTRHELARDDFITAYIKMQGRIRDLYPRDRRMRELFFYEFRSSARAREEEEDVSASPIPPASTAPVSGATEPESTPEETP